MLPAVELRGCDAVEQLLRPLGDGRDALRAPVETGVGGDVSRGSVVSPDASATDQVCIGPAGSTQQAGGGRARKAVLPGENRPVAAAGGRHSGVARPAASATVDVEAVVAD